MGLGLTETICGEAAAPADCAELCRRYSRYRSLYDGVVICQWGRVLSVVR